MGNMLGGPHSGCAGSDPYNHHLLTIDVLKSVPRGTVLSMYILGCPVSSHESLHSGSEGVNVAKDPLQSSGKRVSTRTLRREVAGTTTSRA